MQRLNGIQLSKWEKEASLGQRRTSRARQKRQGKFSKYPDILTPTPRQSRRSSQWGLLLTAKIGGGPKKEFSICFEE